jgi:hypothetical protein
MVTAKEMGSIGGKAKSEAKAKAARKNASKPRGKWVTAIAFELEGVEKHKAFGVVLAKGKGPTNAVEFHDWVCKQIREQSIIHRGAENLNFIHLATSGRLM